MEAGAIAAEVGTVMCVIWAMSTKKAKACTLPPLAWAPVLSAS